MAKDVHHASSELESAGHGTYLQKSSVPSIASDSGATPVWWPALRHGTQLLWQLGDGNVGIYRIVYGTERTVRHRGIITGTVEIQARHQGLQNRWLPTFTTVRSGQIARQQTAGGAARRVTPLLPLIKGDIT